jgi:hypothetical protein
MNHDSLAFCGLPHTFLLKGAGLLCVSWLAGCQAPLAVTHPLGKTDNQTAAPASDHATSDGHQTPVYGTSAARETPAVQEPRPCASSSECPIGDVCCETPMGTAAAGCSQARPFERFPCDFREACSEGGTCRTSGAECRGGWCEVAPRVRPHRCGTKMCGPTQNICWLQVSGELECTSDPHLGGEGFLFFCTAPDDCVEGEFCSVFTMSASCEHLWDGVSEILCTQATDCPAQFFEHCAEQGAKPHCEPATASGLPDARHCQCK